MDAKLDAMLRSAPPRPVLFENNAHSERLTALKNIALMEVNGGPSREHLELIAKEKREI